MSVELQAKSKNVYLDNTARLFLFMVPKESPGAARYVGPSVLPLWRVWEMLVEGYGYDSWDPESLDSLFAGEGVLYRLQQSDIPDMGGSMRFFFERLKDMADATRAALATELDDLWNEELDPEEEFKVDLMMKLLANEGMWVDLRYNPFGFGV